MPYLNYFDIFYENYSTVKKNYFIKPSYSKIKTTIKSANYNPRDLSFRAINASPNPKFLICNDSFHYKLK